MAAAYAAGRLRGHWGRYERTALAIPLTHRRAGLAGPGARRRLGGPRRGQDAAGQAGGDRGPVGKTTRGAPEHLLGWYTDNQVKYGIEIPHVLSLLAFHSWNARVQGLDTVPPADRPPVNVVRVSFQLMVGIGTLLASARDRVRRDPGAPQAAAGLGLVLPRGGAGRAASVVALIAGWVTTEVGRQPWVVYRVMRTSQAVTGAGGLPVGYGTLVAVYLGVGGSPWPGSCAGSPALRWISAPPEHPRFWRSAEPMHSTTLPIVFALIGLVLYIGPRRRRLRRRDLAADGRHRARRPSGSATTPTTRWAPVWEANHVWLIFVFTVVWTAYPVAFGSIASTLSVPLFIAAIGIILRGATYALRSGAGSRGELRRIDGRVRDRLDSDPVRAGRRRRRDRCRARAGRQRRRPPVRRAGRIPSRS